MSFDTIIQLVLAILSGKGDAAAAIASDPKFLLIVFVVTLLAILPTLVKQGMHGMAMGVFIFAAGLAAVYYGSRDINFIVEPGKVLIGTDLASPSQRQSKTSLEGCKQTCAVDTRCIAFTWDQMTEQCYPKSSIVSAHTFPSAISGIRQGPPLPPQQR